MIRHIFFCLHLVFKVMLHTCVFLMPPDSQSPNLSREICNLPYAIVVYDSLEASLRFPYDSLRSPYDSLRSSYDSLNFPMVL